MPDPTPLPDPSSTAIAAQTFSLARKGYDPEEVRTFLEQVQAAVLAGGSSAEQPAPEALAEAERIRAAARQQADGVRAGAAEADGGVDEAITLAVREADELIGAASARVDAIRAEQAAADGAGPVDRWGDLGGHVARLLQQAEEEAVRIAAEAEAKIAALRTEAAQDRTAAAEVLAHAQAQGAAAVAAAEAEVATLVQQAEPRVEAHLEQARSQATEERVASETALAHAISQLTGLQSSLDAALAERTPSPGLPGPLHFLVAPPAAPATTEPDGGAGPSPLDGP